MYPKEYFEKYYSEKKSKYDYNTEQDTFLKKVIIERYRPISKFDVCLSNNDFEYSNDPIINKFMKELFDNIGVDFSNDVYVGKINNPYPNCYAINEDKTENLQGCLICITTGLTDNSFVFGQYLALLNEKDNSKIQDWFCEDFLRIIEFEIVNRIKNKYGDEFATGDLVQIAECSIDELWLLDIQNKASAASYLMDFFAVLHEFVHFLINTFSVNENIIITGLIINIVSLYAEICNINLDIEQLPRKEVLADLGALFILYKQYNFDDKTVITIITAIKQLEKMSKTDIYTNKYRIRIIEFFLSRFNINYSTTVDSIVKNLERLFSLAEGTEEQLKDLKKQALQSINSIIRNGITEATLVYLRERANQLIDSIKKLQMYEESEEEDFEEFL